MYMLSRNLDAVFKQLILSALLVDFGYLFHSLCCFGLAFLQPPEGMVSGQNRYPQTFSTSVIQILPY